MHLLLRRRWRAASQLAVELCPQVFSKVGDVKRIVMGLDKQQLTPCGFCFVVYYTRPDTEDCVKCARLLSKLPPSLLSSFPFIIHHTRADTADCMMCVADRFPVSLVSWLLAAHPFNRCMRGWCVSRDRTAVIHRGKRRIVQTSSGALCRRIARSAGRSRPLSKPLK